MKILYHHRIASKDGQAVHIEELTAALRRAGHEIIMVGPSSYESEEFGTDGGFVATLKRFLPKVVYEVLEFAYAVAAYRRLKRACDANRPDCLYERYNLYLPAGVWLKRRTGLTMLSEVNAPLLYERAKHDGLALPALARRTEETVWRGADRVLPVTDALADYVRAAGVPEERIVVIPNGIDPKAFADVLPREEAKSSLGLAGKLVLGFTGFIRDWHGLPRVIDFIADSDPALNLHFHVVGDGPARAEAEARAAQRGVTDRVTFTGLVPHDAIPAHVAAFDIALQPDVVDYASPLKLFEYMVLACAIVAPDKANIREVVSDGASAVLFDPDSPEAFRAALSRVVTDSTLRSHIAEGARALIESEGYTWDANAARVTALFRELGVTAP
jgi:glycosyltransferase involved in cell wall biosynthesis